jgi:WD40 repeat protein
VEKDIDTGAVKRTFRAHQDTINYFVITDDFRMITTSYDDYLIIWDLATGSILKRILVRITEDYLQSISFVNEVVVGVSAGTRVYQVDLRSGRFVRTIGTLSNLFKLNLPRNEQPSSICCGTR